MLAVIWWMYDGYAWLTNAIATDHLRIRLLLLGGMGAFLVVALAVPHAYDGEGLAFGIGYLAVVALHAGMYVRGTSLSEVRAILRMVPFNLAAARARPRRRSARRRRPVGPLGACCALLLWITPLAHVDRRLRHRVEHFVERHGLVIIVALGESIVVIGAAAAARARRRAGARRVARARASAPPSGGCTSPTRTRSSERWSTRRRSGDRGSP